MYYGMYYVIIMSCVFALVQMCTVFVQPFLGPSSIFQIASEEREGLISEIM